MRSRNRLLFGAIAACLAASPAIAAKKQAADADFVDLSLEELMKEPIEALAKRVNVRERSEAIAPVLPYTEEYFQRFEPLSVGEMLKRTPGVTFASDVGEYAEPSLRGLGAQYTQVQINGRPLAGSGLEQIVLVDRIPAELVDRVEIVRSPSADTDSQGIGGALNIVMKEGADYEGGIYRAGGYYVDGDARPSTFLSYGGSSDAMRWGAALNYQERYNRKEVRAVERAADGEGGALAEFATKIEGDERESRDAALTADLTFMLGGGRELAFDALLIDTDRRERQIERGFEAAAEDGALETEAQQSNQLEDLSERTWLVAATFTAPFGDDRSYELSASYDRTAAYNAQSEYQAELETFDFASVGLSGADDVAPFLASRNDRDVARAFAGASSPFGREINVLDNLDATHTEHIRDSEAAASGRVVWGGGDSTLSAGLEYVLKTRDYDARWLEPDDGELVLQDAGFSAFAAEEERISAFAQWIAARGDAQLELGLRAEHSALELASVAAAGVAAAAPQLADAGFDAVAGASHRSDDVAVNPAAHLLWNASEHVSVRLSAAQTLRRPTFAELNPTLTIDDEHSVLGDAALEPERALGFDAGVDLTRAEDAGILGLNAFYRRIEDKIELLRASDDLNAALQAYVDDDIEALRYANNPNTGVVYGAELDLSYPLTMLGAPNLHVFANYTHMRSRIRDASGGFELERPFNLLPDYHYNVGFDHLIERFGFTWGASYQKRGAAQEWGLDGEGVREVADVTFDGNLEAFIEKTFAQRFVVRLAAQNLLDANRIDTTRLYETAEQYRRGAPVSVERDREESDPHIILTFRGTF